MDSVMDYTQAYVFRESLKAYGSQMGLDGIKSLMQELGDIWKELNIVHIAGTNGKGSVCCFLASALSEAGHCVGQFNSPSVFGARDAYRIRGARISREEYASCMAEAAASCQRMTAGGKRHPTLFEVETAVAFLWFFKRNCDIVLLETGMGGATDATNLIETPLCSVFVPIQLDHMEYLGTSLTEIADIKAGIIKKNCPVVTVCQPKEARIVLKQRADLLNAPYIEAPVISESYIEGDKLCYTYPKLGKLCLFMKGSYQVENSTLAIQTLFLLRERGFACSDTQIRKGIETAKWEGRFECLSQNPCFYIDGAHNPAAAKMLAASLKREFGAFQKIGIMGVMADKDYGEMLEILLPFFDVIYAITPDQPRALPAQTLADAVCQKGGKAKAFRCIKTAVAAAVNEIAGKERHMAAAFGSLYSLREVKQAFYECTGSGQKDIP